MVVRAHLRRWRGEPAIMMQAGDLDATFLPACGMLGVSLRHRGAELLALPHSVAAWKSGATTGLPLLYPWANRLRRRSYEIGRRRVRLTGMSLPVDQHARPIHGTIRSTPFTIRRIDSTGTAAVTIVRLRSTDDPLLSRAFPFPHDLTITTRLDPRRLRVTTTVTPVGPDAVPVSFGWHPYLRLPGERRRNWVLRLPGRAEIALGPDQLPTGAQHDVARSRDTIGTQTFDHLYKLARDRRFAIGGGGRQLVVTFDDHYPYVQLYAPPRAEFLCIEPMTAPVDALSRGATPMVDPGASFSATFAMAVQ